MTQTHDESTRARFAVAIASATTTLAVGVTLAALSGYLHPPTAKPPVDAPARGAHETAPARGAHETAPRAPARASEPALVLVPVERIPTSSRAAIEPQALAYADHESEGHDRDDDDRDSDEHEGRHDD